MGMLLDLLSWRHGQNNQAGHFVGPLKSCPMDRKKTDEKRSKYLKHMSPLPAPTSVADVTNQCQSSDSSNSIPGSTC